MKSAEKILEEALRRSSLDSKQALVALDALRPSDPAVLVARVKAAIIFLANTLDEIENLVQTANRDCWGVMNAA